MKQSLTLTLLLFLFIAASSQETQIYTLKGNGSTIPSIDVKQSAEGIEVELNLEAFTSKTVSNNGISSERILLHDGVNVTLKGQPDIQHLAVTLSIPAKGKTILNITDVSYYDYPDFNIAPSNGDPGENNSFQGSDTSIYNSNAFFPSNVVTSDNPYIWVDARGQVIRFFPIQYNPITKTLRVYDYIKANLSTTDEPGINEITRLSVNAGKQTPLQSLMSTHFMNDTESSRYTTPREKGNMLIIAHPDFIEGVEPFSNWKIQKGIHCEIVDVTTLGDANKIKAFVADYYYTKGLTYLLLVGDAQFVPSMQAGKGVSDNMYGYISGDDHYPEILIGRFSCETTKQLSIMVNRTINYEKSPDDKALYSNFLGIGSGLGPGDDGEMDYEHIRNISNQLLGTSHSKITELYDGSRGGNDQNGNPTAAMTSETINQGQGAVMYIGHGGINSWTTSNYASSDVRQLKNTITHPFIWSAGCNNGSFSDITCLAEEWLRAEYNDQPTGAIATLMSSSTQTWYPPMEAQDEIGLILAGKKEAHSITTFGGISMSGCMKMNDKYGEGGFVTTDTWVLFGDPSVEMRTQSPLTFNPVHDSLTGIDSKSFNISGLTSDAFVCITHNNTILYAATSESDAITTELPDLTNIKSLTITITGTNYRPYISIVPVTQLPAMAHIPSPATNLRNVSTKSTFDWQLNNGCTPEYYTLSIKEKGSTAWDSYVINSVNGNFIPNLKYSSSYEWKIISHNSYGVSESAVFNFVTIHPPDEDFEQNSFPRSNWENMQNWYVDNSESYEGNYSLHSGYVENKGSSSLYYEAETVTCDLISFWLKLNANDSNVDVSFYIDSVLTDTWNETIPWSNKAYPVSPGHHRFEWRFTYSGDSLNQQSAAWIDDIYLPVNQPVLIEKSEQLSCKSTQILIETEVSNYTSLKWESSGTGYFDDFSKVNPVYYPSDEDLLQDEIAIKLTTNTHNTCQAEEFDYTINFSVLAPLPVYNDTTLYMDESFTLSPIEEYNKHYLLQDTDLDMAALQINASQLKPGINVVTVVAENEMGCSISQQFKINVINQLKPLKEALIVYPNPARDQISLNNSAGELPALISIFSSNGQLLEQHEITSSINNSIAINHLYPGMYIIRSETISSSSTTKFIKM